MTLARCVEKSTPPSPDAHTVSLSCQLLSACDGMKSGASGFVPVIDANVCVCDTGEAIAL